MDLSPFLVVLSGGGDDRGSGIGWWRRGNRWCGVWIGSCHGCAVGGALEDGHQTGNDDDDRPAMVPGEDIEGIEREEYADKNQPDGPTEGAEEPELIAGGAVVDESAAGVGHLADEDPYAEADQEKGNEAVNGKRMEEASVANEEEAAESDEPDGAGWETVSRR